MTTYQTSSAQETEEIGRELGKKLTPGSVICFFGELGAGKTTLIKGIVSAVSSSSELVNSPTFVYLNIYSGTPPVYHFDLYRLRDADEFLGMGFDEFLHADGICCIEWSERIKGLLSHCWRVEIQHGDQSENRIITIQGPE